MSTNSSLRRRATAEFLGTLLVATVIGSGIMAERLAGTNVALALLANKRNRRDPKGQSLEAVGAIRDDIHDRVKELIRTECAECCKTA